MPRALQIKTQEGGTLLAKEELSHSVLSFAKDHQAEVSLVETEEAPLGFRDLAEALKKPLMFPQRTKVRQLELLYTPIVEEIQKNENTIIKKENYKDYLDQAGAVKRYIYELLINGGEVSLASLQEWATSNQISLSKGGLSRHLQKTLEEFVSQGYNKIKTKKAYRIEKR